MSTTKPPQLAFSQAPLVDNRGMATFAAIKQFNDIFSRVWAAIDALGNIVATITGQIAANATIQGKTGTVGTLTSNIDGATGVVAPAGMTPATDTTQGVVILPVGAPSHTLGSAAIAQSTDFDAAGSAATAQANAIAYAQNASNINSGLLPAPQTQPLSNISGQITTSQLPAAGISVTIVTAALTGVGTQGSMTFTNGILTAQTPAT